MPEEFRKVDMRVCTSRSGTVFLWPVPLPAADGRDNPWNMTARAAAEVAETKWARMSSNRSAGCYDTFVAPSNLPDPVWPEETLGDLLKVAFGNGRLIDNIGHPVIRRLQGY
jgi:hypothetical protein